MSSRNNRKKSALVLTVGTGNLDQLEETLFTPLRKSLTTGRWSKVVFLPSKFTEEFAEKVRKEIEADIEVEVSPLPEAGLENDPDRCFEHYDQVLADLKQQGYRSEHILVDFTRGTKAMSAAIVLAAVRHDLPHLRYITGRRDQRGMVVPGSEQIVDLGTTVATGQRLLDQAVRFMRQGHFSAVLDMLPDPQSPFSALFPPKVRDAAGWLIPLATFYAEWDRLDYQEAAKVSLPPQEPPRPSWKSLYPSSEAVSWVRSLSTGTPQTNDSSSDTKALARHLAKLSADLFANGLRRIAQHQFEDAVIRAYRVVELLGQRRLFLCGLDSAKLPAEHPVVKELEKKLEKNKDQVRFGRNRDGSLNAGRELVARLLKRLGDPLAEDLLQIGRKGILKPQARNYSVLIHGFRAASPGNKEFLEELYDNIASLLKKDQGPELEVALFVSRFDLQLNRETV